jgi:hypothetical protein
MLAAVVLAGGAALLLVRRRSYLAFEGADSLDPAARQPIPPEPMQRPTPTPAPATPVPTPAPAAVGIVSTRLRPWIDVEFIPGRCILDHSQATVEFVIRITNSGTANARDLRVEALLFNAGPDQDDEIGAFFAHPLGRDETMAVLPPLQTVEIRSSVSLPVERMRLLDAAGRKLFVPLIGFNALYRWGGGEGQTSRSYLLGREGAGEKMAPFRADLGPRVFRGLGARLHSLEVRR